MVAATVCGMDIDGRFYRLGPAGELIELAPKLCPNGHPLGPGTVLVGSRGATGSRTWTCQRCGASWTVQPLAGAVTWPGVPLQGR